MGKITLLYLIHEESNKMIRPDMIGQVVSIFYRRGDEQYFPDVRILEIDGSRVKVERVWPDGRPFQVPFWTRVSEIIQPD